LAFAAYDPSISSPGALLLGAITLPAVVSLGLALGIRRLRSRSALTRARRKHATVWLAEEKLLIEAHVRSLEEHQSQMKAAREAWEREDRERIASGLRVLAGDEEAIDEAITGAITDLDFPLETTATVGIDSAREACICVDLPEIDDVIPVTRRRVLRDGRVREVRRKVGERNRAYAELVVGLGMMIAAAAFAAAPSIELVRITAFSQRKKRRSETIADEYLYEIQIPRTELISAPRWVDPLQFAASLPGTRLDLTSRSELKAIAAPSWVNDLR
jgi:hypothetical protein